MRFNIFLTTLTTAIAFQTQEAHCYQNGFSQPTNQPLPPNTLNPWIGQIGSFFGNFLCPWDCATRQYLVFGGSANYSTSSYPQFILYDLFEAVLTDSTNFGGVTDLSVNSENFKNYFWNTYGGYHCGLDGNWDIGVEIGYKKLLRTESSTNIVRATVVPGTLFTPFRDTSTYVWDVMATARYTTYSGFNLFVKAGGAKVNTQIKEGNFIATTTPALSGTNAFGTRTYNLVNIYPEVEIGAGFRFLNHFDIHFSYAKIFGPDENDLISTSTIVFRPRKCPSIDIFSISLEMLIF